MTPPALKHLTPTEAHDLLQQDPRALLVDIRSTAEVLFVGHPVGAIHVPWLDEPEWTINPDFVRRVRELVLGGIATAEGATPILLICRSGKRSLEAGRALLEAGFTDIYNVLEGFEGDLDDHHHRSAVGGWRFEGLPWEQC